MTLAMALVTIRKHPCGPKAVADVAEEAVGPAAAAGPEAAGPEAVASAESDPLGKHSTN